MTDPIDETPTPRRFRAKPDKRSTIPFVIAAVAGLGLLTAIWALSDNVGANNVGSNKLKAPQTNQTTGLGTAGSVDQPMKSDLQK